MMSLFIQLFINNKEDISNPGVKKAYATLSSIVGTLLNLFLCMAKITIGLLSHSVAVSADGYNNLSDAEMVPALAQPLTWYILPDCKKERKRSVMALWKKSGLKIQNAISPSKVLYGVSV